MYIYMSLMGVSFQDYYYSMHIPGWWSTEAEALHKAIYQFCIIHIHTSVCENLMQHTPEEIVMAGCEEIKAL